MSWFGERRTPGGSVIVQHGEQPEIEVDLDEHLTRYTTEREEVYEKVFGQALSVSHEVFPLVPHVDVYTHRRSQGDKNVYSLVTGGMSDLPMTLPRSARDEVRRAELIFYCSEPREEYVAMLRWLAHFPHTYKTCLGYGHTIPNGNPPAPFWGSEALDTILFMPPIVVRDQTLQDELQLEGDPVHFLWVVPLTSAECNLKLHKGFDAILELFEEHRHPHVFDPTRKSYV
jgi:hypothetical protein